MLYVAGSASIFLSCNKEQCSNTGDEIIGKYFNLGLTAPEIASFLVSVHAWYWSFSFPEAALLLVSTKNRHLWPGPTTFRF